MAAPQADSGWPGWWLRRSAVSWALWPLSRVYGAAVALRATLYRAGLLPVQRLAVPVVVVGNLTVGGTGKTPLIAALATGLRRAGWTPGIVSRGYGRAPGAAETLPVGPDSDPRQCGDEPVLLARMAGCPVVVGRRRAEAGRALLAAHPEIDVVLADDGLQHFALARDVELVVVDERLWGNGWLLPAGPLREPPGRRCDAMLGAESALARLPAAGRRFVLERRLGELHHPAGGERLSAEAFARQLAGRPLAAAAGIGNPGQFFAMLRGAGLAPRTVALPDHRPLDPAALDALPADAPIIVTAKDAIKSAALPPALRERLWVAELRLGLPDDLLPWLTRRLEAARGRTTA